MKMFKRVRALRDFPIKETTREPISFSNKKKMAIIPQNGSFKMTFSGYCVRKSNYN